MANHSVNVPATKQLAQLQAQPGVCGGPHCVAPVVVPPKLAVVSVVVEAPQQSGRELHTHNSSVLHLLSLSWD